jgi:hypothetical protein
MNLTNKNTVSPIQAETDHKLDPDSAYYCKCGEPGIYSHACPYSQELYNNPGRCNCCSHCTRQCANDV